jgi:hypothetical protein
VVKGPTCHRVDVTVNIFIACVRIVPFQKKVFFYGHGLSVFQRHKLSRFSVLRLTPSISVIHWCYYITAWVEESDIFPKPPWRERKEAYLKLVETASLPALLVIVADKLQNSRALLRRLKLEGAEGWGSPSRKEKLWYIHNLLEAMRHRLTRLEQETDHPTLVSVRLLIDEYAEVVATLTRY